MDLSPDPLHTVYKRSSILQCLAEGTTEKRAIVADLNISRSTVDRAFSELEDIGFISGCGSDYELTLLEKFAFQQYRTLAKQYTNLLEAGPLLTELPADARFPFEIVEDSNIYSSTKNFGARPIFQIRERLENSDTIWAAMPVILPSQIETITRELQMEDASGKLILDSKQVELLLETSPQYIRMLDSAESVSILSCDQLPPFGIIALDDEEVLVTIHTKDRQFKGVLSNETPAANTWAVDFFNDLEQVASSIPTNHLSAASD